MSMDIWSATGRINGEPIFFRDKRNNDICRFFVAWVSETDITCWTSIPCFAYNSNCAYIKIHLNHNGGTLNGALVNVVGNANFSFKKLNEGEDEGKLEMGMYVEEMQIYTLADLTYEKTNEFTNEHLALMKATEKLKQGE